MANLRNVLRQGSRQARQASSGGEAFGLNNSGTNSIGGQITYNARNYLSENFGGYLQQKFGLPVNVTEAWAKITRVLPKISNFNFNATDEEIRKKITLSNTQLAESLGESLGAGIAGIVTVGLGNKIAYSLPTINSVELARKINEEVTEEAIDNVGDGLLDAFTYLTNYVADKAVLETFISFRKAIKSLPESKLAGIFGKDTADFLINKWGTAGQPELSFTSFVDDTIESINNDVVEAFLEGAVDEFFDSFIQFGAIIARNIDDAIEEARLARSNGVETTIEVFPEPESNESFSITGNTEEIRAELQATINTVRVIGNRDVGFFGQDRDQLLATYHKRKITIEYSAVELPPFSIEGKPAKRITVNIPDVVSGLTWSKLKKVCKPYKWGDTRITATLNNRRQIAFYASTEEEAVKVLDRWLELTTAKIVGVPRFSKGVTKSFGSQQIDIEEEEIKIIDIYPKRAILIDYTAQPPKRLVLPIWQEDPDPNLPSTF